MKKLMTFINNIRYLFRYNLKEMNKATDRTDINNALSHIKYEIEQDLKNMRRIVVKSKIESVFELLHSNKSICRFGDGEIMVMLNEDLCFQKANPLLAERLKEILSSNDDDILIAIIPLCLSMNDFYYRNFWGKNKSYMISFLHDDKTYFHTGLTFPYMSGFGEEEVKDIYSMLRQIWDKKKIVVIAGERVLNKIKHNVFDNAETIEYIKAPTTNAFDEYEAIFDNAKKYDKDHIFLISLGPTATVLAYDLAKLGYRALDVGHIVKDYDCYLSKVLKNQENRKEFFDPD